MDVSINTYNLSTYAIITSITLEIRKLKPRVLNHQQIEELGFITSIRGPSHTVLPLMVMLK